MKKYDNYKDSGIEWIGKIPSHWGVKRGKYLFKIVSGYSPENVEEQIRKFGIPYFKVNDLNDKSEVFNLEKSNLYVADDILNTSPKETILFPKRGAAISTNKVKISTSDCIFDTNIMGLIPFKEKIHSRYLAYSISNRGLWDIADTSTIPQINNKHIEPLEFVLPETIEEQKNIVEFIDHKTSQIDHLIAKKEQFIKLLEEERVAVINQAVTKGLDPKVPMKDSGVEWLGEIPEHWEVKSFRFCIDVLTDYTANGSFASLAENVTYFDSGYSRLVRLTDLRVNLENDGLYVDEHAHNFLKKSELFGGELLIANVGAYAGLVMQMPRMEGKFTLGPNMFLLRLNQNTDFFISQLNAPFCAEQLKMMAVSSAQPKLNKENIRQLKVVTPPIEEQEKIVAYLKTKTIEFDSLTNNTNQEIELLKEYKTALISEVVTGKVDVRDKKLN